MGGQNDKTVLFTALIIVVVITLIVLLGGPGTNKRWPLKRLNIGRQPPAPPPCAWLPQAPTKSELIEFVEAFEGGDDDAAHAAWTAEMIVGAWRKQKHWCDIGDFARWAHGGLTQNCWHPDLRKAAIKIVSAVSRTHGNNYYYSPAY